MSPEEKLEMGRKLIAEAEAEIAAKKRNWPEKIEAGMLFGLREFVYIYTDFGDLVIVRSSEGAKNEGKRFAPASGFAGREEDFTYLGHARDRIKIADGSHEPTGAELVGKMCQFSDDGKIWTKPGECDEFDPSDREMAYHSAVELTLDGDAGRTWFEFARLAR